ncbi:uncharacterized protein LOC135467699 isoform X2 [Liolophura sinensis]
MATDPADDPSEAPSMDIVTVVVPVVVVAVVLIMALAIFIYWYCCKRRKELNKQAIAEHALCRQTVKDHPTSVYTVEKNFVSPIVALNVTSERRLRYSGEPAVSSLPTSGRSVSYDCLGDRDRCQPWQGLRNSVASDNGYYVPDVLHSSTSQLSQSVEPRQSFLQDSESTPERSLSSDHIEARFWPGVGRRPVSKASSLGRDSGLGGSQETCLSYQTDLKASLSNFSMCSSEAEYDLELYSERPKSLPPMCGSLASTEVQKIEHIPLRSMYPCLPRLDENDNQPDVYKHIQSLRDKFYTLRNQAGAPRDEAPRQIMGTPNFVIGIFGTEGGHLQLFDGSATLAIPQDALPFEQEVYLYAYYENACIDGKSYLRRVIECGPDGLAFKTPVCLSFIPRLIPCDENESETDVDLKVVFKNNEPDSWRSLKKSESFFHAQHEFVSIHVDHFTRFTVEPAGGSVQLAAGASSAHVTSPHNQPTESRKFYVSVYVGQALNGVNEYRVCFIEKDKDKLQAHNKNMNQEGFRSAVASPKAFSLTSEGRDVRIEIPSIHGCEFKSSNTKHVVPIDEFDDQTVEDIGPPCRHFLLGLAKPNTGGLFEVAVFQENVHDKVLTFCVSINHNAIKDKLSHDSRELTHQDVLEFLAGNRLAKYDPNVCFPKNMKLDICTKVEGLQTHGWYKLAEAAQIPGNKYKWLESYVREKHVTPCYVVLDFIEAKLIAKDVGIGKACDQLTQMLDRSGFEVAADFCKSWKVELLKQRSHHKEKGGRMSFGRRDDYANLSPSREELGTIPEESNTSRTQTNTRGENSPASRRPYNMTLELRQGPNGGVGLPLSTYHHLEKQFSSDVSPTLLLDNSGMGHGNSLPSPSQTPFAISRAHDSMPQSTRRPNKVLVKGNREKSGRNDSGIGSDIASPVDSEGDRSSHI